MMIVYLTRSFMSDNITFGGLKVEGFDHQPIFTLEEPWRGNARQISCIPDGSYICEPYSSKKFPNAYIITNVPDRSYILIHPGNDLDDTSGCILPGLVCDSERKSVFKSRAAFDILKNIIHEEKFILRIGGQKWA